MPILRNAVLAVMPARWRSAAEAESRLWIATCPHCGHQASVWDLGALRWKAHGNPRMGLTCLACHRIGMQKLHKTGGQTGSGDGTNTRADPAP